MFTVKHCLLFFERVGSESSGQSVAGIVHEEVNRLAGVREAAFNLVGGSPEIRAHGETYFNYRIWSAPAALAKSKPPSEIGTLSAGTPLIEKRRASPPV